MVDFSHSSDSGRESGSYDGAPGPGAHFMEPKGDPNPDRVFFPEGDPPDEDD